MIAAPVIGHRGAAALAPENTLAGIRKAAESGVSWVELDVTLLGDGTPVLCHDDQLDRCTNHSGPLSGIGVIDLPALDAGSWFHPDWTDEPVPHLSDALLLCQQLNLGLNLEIKPFSLNKELVAHKIHEEISVFWNKSDALIISSYDQELLGRYREISNDTQLALLYDHLPELWILQARHLNPVSIHCDCHFISTADIAAIKSEGYELYCFTCNDPEQALRLWNQGVDGLFTDHPALLLERVPELSLDAIPGE